MKKSIIKRSTFALILILVLTLSYSNVVAQEATDSSETIREKVQEKLDRALNKPKAYVGLITDITDSTIQINNLEDEIQQIVILPDETTYVNVGENEDIEYEDVAIGDEIVAIGYVDENNTLSGLRILVTSTEEDEQRTLYNAEVVSVEDRTIVINDYEKGEVSLTFPSRWKGPEIDEFEGGQMVAAVSLNDDGKLTIRTIEILSDIEASEE